MTKDDIIRMARESGFEQFGPDIEAWGCFTEELERFAQLVAAKAAAAEREACAKVCEKEWSYHEEEHAGKMFAEEIRARGQQ